jgi:ATP-dependent protease ClpP protease subunit
MLTAVVLAAALTVPAAPETFYLWGPISEQTAPYVLGWLKHAQKPILYINSPGGELQAALQIADAIKAKKNVRCVVTGLAASGAFAVFQACASRTMVKGAKLATHEPRVGTRDPVERTAMAIILLTLELTTEQWNAYCRQRLKVTPKEYESRVKGRDWVMEWQEALKVGATDYVL